uniref:CARD domain-containing protein n=1 Tax=Seriola dumerili TaxID=41447 RepID=A0A3B4U090_SERDU
MDMLKSKQSQLCMWLSADPDYILQQCVDMLSVKEFRDIQKQSSDLEKMRLLLKITIEKGRNACQSFSDILRQHQAHYQQLQQLFSPNAQGKDQSVKRLKSERQRYTRSDIYIYIFFFYLSRATRRRISSHGFHDDNQLISWK